MCTLLCFYTSLFQTVFLYFDTTPLGLNKFFEPVLVEYFRLFWKLFLNETWN